MVGGHHGEAGQTVMHYVIMELRKEHALVQTLHLQLVAMNVLEMMSKSLLVIYFVGVSILLLIDMT